MSLGARVDAEPFHSEQDPTKATCVHLVLPRSRFRGEKKQGSVTANVNRISYKGWNPGKEIYAV